MPIKPDEIGTDDALARRILVRAREVAPCLAAFPDAAEAPADDPEDRKDALAILQGVYKRAGGPAASDVASRSRNGTAIAYREVVDAFRPSDLSGLRSICGAAAGDSGGGKGSFPIARPLARLWPEGEYS